MPSHVVVPTPSSIDQNINVLLLGEQGVGKATFINALVNYLRYNNIEQAESNDIIVLKPLSFLMTSNDTFQTVNVRLGDVDGRDRSTAQHCHTYTYDLTSDGEKKLCLIDTPSFVDTGDSNAMNAATTKHILDYVNNLTHLNAICLLLEPDALRLLKDFQSCFAHLLNRLGAHARKNVVFCFTNALVTFNTPGTTALLLRNMFAAYSMNEITFSRNNAFFFDNESFRYLIAGQNGVRFTREDRREYTASWTQAVDESKRLVQYVRTQLVPCRIEKKK